MKRVLVVVALALCVAGLGAWWTFPRVRYPLTRDVAKKLLQANRQLTRAGTISLDVGPSALGTCYRTMDDDALYHIAELTGLIVTHKKYPCWDVQVTDKGHSFFEEQHVTIIKGKGYESWAVSLGNVVVDEVTGISSSGTAAQVTFKWTLHASPLGRYFVYDSAQYRALPEKLRDSILMKGPALSSAGDGKRTLQLYDDGWRIVE